MDKCRTKPPLGGVTVYCVEYKNPPIGREGPGKWLSYDSQYTSLEQVINKFALKKEFKDPLINGGLVIRKYRVNSSLKVRNGVVGELYDDFYRKTLNGGANQLQVLENNSNWYSGQWRNFLTYVEDIAITN